MKTDAQLEEAARQKSHVRWLTLSGISEEEIASWMHVSVYRVRSIKDHLGI